MKLSWMRYGLFAVAVVVSTSVLSSVFRSQIPSFAQETFFVNTIDDLDDGICDAAHCSLREAISAANIKVNGDSADRIYFEIAGDAPHAIIVTRPLPIITDPVVIDATTNPDFLSLPVVEIRGENSLLDGFVVTAGESTIKGFAIQDFKGSGIELSGYGGNNIVSNHLCFSSNDQKPYSNAIGITINNVSGNTIGGTTKDLRNVIAGCSRVGVVVTGEHASQNRIVGNFLGVTDREEKLMSPISILIDRGQGNIIGGVTHGEKNILWAEGNEIVYEGGVVGEDVKDENIILE